MKSPKCKKGKPSSFEGFPLITIQNFAESLGQVPARDPFAAPFYLRDNIDVYPKASVILNAVKDLALELYQALCEILRVAQNDTIAGEIVFG